MPRGVNRRTAGGSKKGHSLGAKAQKPAGKTEWILRFKDKMIEILFKSNKGVRPTDREVHRALKRQYKGQTPAWETLRGWRAGGKKLAEGDEDALKANSGRKCQFTDTHQQQIDDALWENKYLPDATLPKEIREVAKKFMKDVNSFQATGALPPARNELFLPFDTGNHTGRENAAL